MSIIINLFGVEIVFAVQTPRETEEEPELRFGFE